MQSMLPIASYDVQIVKIGSTVFAQLTAQSR